MGIDTLSALITAITGIIEQQTFMDKNSNVWLPSGRAASSIAEVPILGTAPTDGEKIWKSISPASHYRLHSAVRHDMVPRGDTRILAGGHACTYFFDKQEMAAIKELTDGEKH